jgi:hypothetical protein
MLALILSLSLFVNCSQETVEDKTWYIWLDTTAQIDGKLKRIVSKEPFSITCCVKSGKYNRLQKSAQKWIKNNYDPSFETTSVLKNILDKDLALEVIEKAKLASKTDDGIIMVDYSDSCK